MSSHPAAGVARVEPLRPWLGDALQAVDGHHECWDGSGYPRGIPAGDLPLSTRIVALADAVETMTAARSYKSPMSMQEARAEVASCAGGQFDPAVARAFLGVSVPRLWRVAGPLAWLAQVPLLGVVLQGSLAPGAAFVQGAVLTAGQVAGTAAMVATALVASGAGPAGPAAAQRAAVAASHGGDRTERGRGRTALERTRGWATSVRPPDDVGTADGSELPAPVCGPRDRPAVHRPQRASRRGRHGVDAGRRCQDHGRRATRSVPFRRVRATGTVMRRRRVRATGTGTVVCRRVRATGTVRARCRRVRATGAVRMGCRRVRATGTVGTGAVAVRATGTVPSGNGDGPVGATGRHGDGAGHRTEDAGTAG